MAGPFCATMLADLGADVIKIEPPSGDSTRRMVGAIGTESPAFNAVNRGKRSLVVNLKIPDGQQLLKRLAASSDILIENYRPGVMRGLGLGYDALAAINPRLIYASISGYGQTGPDRAKGGFDLIAQGVSGIMSITGEPGRPPVKAGIPLTDLGAGLFALAGVLAALHHRSRTGRRPVRRHVARRGRRGAVGVGGDRVLRRSERAGAAGIGPSDERAVPGDPVRGRIRHDGRQHRPAVRSGCAACSAIPSGPTRRSSRTTPAACATGRGWPR